MRNPAVANIYGNGKSRSKPIYRPSISKVMAAHKGYQKTMALYAKVIRKTGVTRLIKLSKLSLGIKKGIHTAMQNAVKIVPKKKLNINLGLKK